MFYSHEVLTSRKYGVATVWLVATLGSKSSSKKVSRKAILDVDISKACETIAEPTAPMALRLQSSLLYGVTRVFNQQCGYVLADVESARKDMRVLAKALRTSALESEGRNRGRPEQLVLHDDPNFLPEVNFNISGLNVFDDIMPDFEHDSNPTLMLSSKHNSIASISHQNSSSIALEIPSLHSPSIPRSLRSIRLQRSGAVVDGPIGQREQVYVAEYEGLQDDLGLDIEDIATYSLARSPIQVGPAQQLDVPPLVVSGIDLEEPVHDKEHDVFMRDDDAAGAFDGADWQTSAWMRDASPLDAAASNVVATSSSASAPLQRRRAHTKKVIRQDNNTQLRNQDLKEWAQNYLHLMDEQRRQRLITLARSLAKDNARFWFYGPGNPMLDPLADFQSAALLRVTAPVEPVVSPKRARDRADDLSVSGRRVRSRQASGETDFNQGEHEPIPMFDEVEVGRDQPTPLADPRHSTTLPWSQSIESKRPTSSLMFRMSSSAGSRSRLPSLQPRTIGRLTLASPLHDHVTNRGDSIPRLASKSTAEAAVDDADFEAYGPAGQVDTQTATESQWLRSVLDDESMNFLAFLADAADGDYGASDVFDDTRDRSSIGFAELLPPAQHTAIVAAQAFLHVLTLSTCGFLRAEQVEPTDDIQLEVV